MCFEVDICPDLLIALAVLFAAVAFAALYIAITMNGRRRKRRSIEQEEEEGIVSVQKQGAFSYGEVFEALMFGTLSLDLLSVVSGA